MNLQQQYYVSDGTGTAERPELFAPTFNFSGFQWVQITGSDGAPLPERIETAVLSVQEIRTNMPETGTFSSSSPLLDEIHDVTRNSVAMNHVAGYSMDTPTYEKDGWTGDAQLIAPTAGLMFDTQRQWKKTGRPRGAQRWECSSGVTAGRSDRRARPDGGQRRAARPSTVGVVERRTTSSGTNSTCWCSWSGLPASSSSSSAAVAPSWRRGCRTDVSGTAAASANSMSS